MAGVKAQKHFNAVEMAMMTHQKSDAQAVNIGLGDDVAREAGADMAAELDDWNLLEKMAKEQVTARRGFFSRRPDRIVYQGSELSIDRSSKRASGDPLLLMPGVSMELTGVEMEPTESQEGKKRQEFSGKGGYMVLIPQGSANAAIMPVQEVTVSNKSIAALGTRNEGSKSNGVIFLEPGKRYVLAGRLELKDQTIDLLEASQYPISGEETISGKGWEKVEGMTITAAGISEGTVIGGEQQTAEPGGQGEPADVPPVPAPSVVLPEAPILIKGKRLPKGMMKNHELLPKEGAVVGESYEFQDATLHIELNDWRKIPSDLPVTGLMMKRGWGDDATGEYVVAGNLSIPLDESRCIRISGLRFDKAQGVWLANWIREKPLENAEEDEEEGEEDGEDEEEERDAAADALSILSDLSQGASLREIEEKWKDIYGEDEDEDKEDSEALFQYEQEFGAEFVLVPGLSVTLDLKTAVLLDKFINKPDLSQGNPLELSAGLLGSCSLSLRAGLETGVPYLFSIGGGITGTLAVEGTGEKKELIAGKASVSLEIEKDKDTGKSHLVMTEFPVIQFTAGIQLVGSVGADISASSRIFGWSKSLYEIEFGKWEIARVTGVAELQKEDKDFHHLFRNWKFSTASLNVAVFGNEIYEKSLKSNYGLQNVKELVQNREAYNKEQYGILLEKLQQFLSHSGEQVLIGTGPESDGLQSMVQQAKDLKEEALLQLNLEHTALQVNINETDRLLADRGQKKEREDYQEMAEKHQKRLRQLEENPQNAKKTRGYQRARMEELQKEHLFGPGSEQALQFYQEKQREEAQKDLLNTDAAFQGALQAGTADPRFIREVLEKKLKLSKREILMHYATLEDIRDYEKGRQQFYLQQAMQEARKETPEKTIKAVTEKGDYSWIRIGGVDKILAYEQEKAGREALANQKGVQKIEAEGLTKSTEKSRLLANSRQELIDTYQEILQPNPHRLEQQYQATAKSLRKTEGGENARFGSTIKSCLTLEMLLDYEQIRLKQCKVSHRQIHQERIDRLESDIAKRNLQRAREDEEAAQATERAGVDRYVEETDRFMNQLRQDKITVPGLKYAVVAREAKERMEDEWIRKLKTAQEGDATALLDLQLPPEVEKQIGEALYQKRQGEQASGGPDLTGYRQAKKLELFRGKKTYSHTERYQELFQYWEDHGREQVNPDLFVQKYISLGGGAGYAGQFDFGSVSWEAVNEYLALIHENDPGNTKHLERMNELEEMSGEPSEKVVEHYLGMISRLPFGENFITAKYDTVVSRITPAQIMEREKRDNQYDGIVKFLSDYSARKQQAEAENGSSREVMDRAYEEYQRVFMKDHHGYLQSKSKEMEAQAELPADVAQIRSYEAGRLQEYEGRLHELEESKRLFQETSAEITRRILELDNQLKTLEQIIADPQAFLNSSGRLPDDHPLVSARDEIGAEQTPALVEI